MSTLKEVFTPQQKAITLAYVMGTSAQQYVTQPEEHRHARHLAASLKRLNRILEWEVNSWAGKGWLSLIAFIEKGVEEHADNAEASEAP